MALDNNIPCPIARAFIFACSGHWMQRCRFKYQLRRSHQV